MELILERRSQANETPVIGSIALTPAIHDDYWAYRVKLTDTQAILGFPKFATIGIGFASEEDWNTNLPYTCETEKIWQHIADNKGDDAISDDDCREAIRMIQEAIREDRATPPEQHQFPNINEVRAQLADIGAMFRSAADSDGEYALAELFEFLRDYAAIVVDRPDSLYPIIKRLHVWLKE